MFRYNLKFKRAAISLLLLLISGSADARHPLEPADTSSPQAAMGSFLTLTDEVAQRLVKYRDAPSPASQKVLQQAVFNVGRLLDLSQVPPAARREVGPETSLLLWDVMARLQLPHLEEIPDTSAIMEPADKTKGSAEWQVPGTEITIARVAEGPRAGEFLFSPDTVERLPGFYEAVHELPYRRPMPSDDLIQTNQQLTGWMIPMAWVEILPDWAKTPLLGQVLWKWFAVLLLSGLALGAIILVFRWARRRDWGGSLSAYVRRLSAPLVTLALALLLRYLFQEQINLTGTAADVPDYIIEVARDVALIWLIWLTASWIAEAIIASTRVRTGSLDVSLIRLAARTVGILAIIVLLFRAAAAVGIPVYGLVAGAGVGGLAIALAARGTLENFLGTLSLFVDHPVRVGDFCRYGEDPSPAWQRTGTVEEIGLRSTRIRGLDRTITTIPNADFANMHIVNLTNRDRIAFRPTLALRYETTFDQLRLVLAKLRELLLAHPRVTDAPARVRFVGFGEYSLNVEIFAYVTTSDWNEYLAIQEDIDLRILQIIEEVGTGFATPSRLYLTRDTGIQDERQQAATKQVQDWVAAQNLPFPDFPDEYRKQIKDTLDYPPQGSPDAGKR